MIQLYKRTAGRISSEDRGSVIESEGKLGIEGEQSGRQIAVKATRSGAPILVTTSYTENPDSRV